MKKVAIVTDCTACLPQEVIDEYGIISIPYRVYLDGKPRLDGVEIHAADVYEWQQRTKSKELPYRETASIEEYAEAFRQASEQAESIACISISSGYARSMNVASAARETMPEIPIEVFDTHTTGGALGLIVLACARAAASGESLAQVIKIAEEKRARVTMVAALDTLDYVVRGGRVRRVIGLMGAMLNIKPILDFSSSTGTIEGLARARSRGGAIDTLVRIMKERVGREAKVRAWINYGGMPDESLEALKERVRHEFDCLELYTTPWTAIMAVYTGPIITLALCPEP
jgi:DegV family protein with EDD domain